MPADLETAAAAQLLNTVLSGLQVLAKADPDHAGVDATIETAFASLVAGSVRA